MFMPVISVGLGGCNFILNFWRNVKNEHNKTSHYITDIKIFAHLRGFSSENHFLILFIPIAFNPFF